jgi:hypothetical protein
MVGLGEFGEKPFHLVPFERHIDFDGSVTGDRRRDPGANGFQINGLIFARELFEDFVQHVLDLGGVHTRGRYFYGNTASAEGLGFESIMRKFFRDLTEDRLLSRSQFQHKGHQQALAFDALCGALP